MSQADLWRSLGGAQSAISNIEVGREGLPAKRAYAWADALHLPRDDFFRLVVGELEELKLAKRPAVGDAAASLSAAERELVERYRQLPRKFQRQLHERVAELEALASR